MRGDPLLSYHSHNILSTIFISSSDQSAYPTGVEGLIMLSSILLPHAHHMERQEGSITFYLM